MTAKRWIACLLAAVLIVFSGCAPHAPTQDLSEQSSPTTQPSYNPAVGQVRVYTCDPALQAGFTTLAERYYQQTGIRVLVTLAEGSCQEGLAQALASEEAPTLFCLHSQQDLERWSDSLYDLTGTSVLDKLVSPDFAMEQAGKILALTAHTQGYGLIYNASLLARAGFTRSDITDFTQLQLVSQYITSQDMGFAAFAAPALEAASHKGTACLLSGIGAAPGDLRTFWDLYIENGSSQEQGLASLLDTESVFCLGGSWDHGTLEPLGSSSLDILPAYTPSGGSLGYTVELCWGINGKTAKIDLQRTLEFLNWLVTAQETDTPVDALGLFAPFTDAKSYANPLEKKLREYMTTEPICVRWQCCGGLDDQALQAFRQALAQYTADPTQENWEAVVEILP